MAQSVERRIGSAEVTGPIPVSSFKNGISYWSSVFLYIQIFHDMAFSIRSVYVRTHPIKTRGWNQYQCV